jgi:hypothetical protein
MEYYYKVQWGHQQEFLQLFLKNHYPLLQEERAERPHALGEDRDAGQPHHRGRPLGLPRHHPLQELDRGDHRQSRRRAFIKELWPDQERYQREEQRRFEILLGHWDLPVTDITPANK